MNRIEMVHNERKEYWRGLITSCDASGMNQKDWCHENGICSTSMSKWRNVIWREEEAEKEFAAAREEHCFVEIKQKEGDPAAAEAVTLSMSKKAPAVRNTSQGKQTRYSQVEPRLIQPDAVIGCKEFVIGVYEHTSSDLLQRVMEVLKYA